MGKLPLLRRVVRFEIGAVWQNQSTADSDRWKEVVCSSGC